METPYTDIETNESEVTRKFSDDVDPIELKWHRDNETREIVSESSTDWMIQLDNALPVSLNNPVLIHKHAWHRLIKGTGDLILKIKKY